MQARFLLMTLLALALAACTRDARLPEVELTGDTMGTTFSIKLVAPPETLGLEDLEDEIAAALGAVNALTSTYLDDSEISLFNATDSTDWVPVSPAFCAVVERALEISEMTGGAFDITVGPLVNLWGFGPDVVAPEPPAVADIVAARERVGYRRVETRCDEPAVRKQPADVYLDLSAWAKGYGVDRLAEILDKHRVDNYLVEIGGELRVSGLNASRQKWAIAIEKPLPLARGAQQIIRVTDTSVATSGDYRNFYEYGGKLYSHTIDARTGRPVEHQLAAVTVVADSAAEADALATALLVLGPGDGMAFAEAMGVAGYFLVRRDDKIEATSTGSFDTKVMM
jgi:thiamine biosynthesis lipoprotein